MEDDEKRLGHVPSGDWIPTRAWASDAPTPFGWDDYGNKVRGRPLVLVETKSITFLQLYLVLVDAYLLGFVSALVLVVLNVL